MYLFFSSPINRLIFLVRYVVLSVVLGLAGRVVFLFASHDPGSSPALLAWAFLAVMALGGFFYHIRFILIARLDSMGLSRWYCLLTLLPFVSIGLYEWSGVINIISIGPVAIYVIYLLMLITVPEDAFRHGSALQATVYDYEVGEGRIIVRLVPLLVGLVLVGSAYNFMLYRGLDDAQSMDNAQLARQIVRGEGYTTKFLRPQAVLDLRNYATSQSLITGQSGALFPANQFPPGTPRILPDTYNAPGYPYLLASWFYLVRPQFDQPVAPRLEGFVDEKKGGSSFMYSGDRWIPALNLIFVVLTGLLVYVIGRRLFDDRTAWFAVVAFFGTDMIWQFSLTAMSTSFLMFLVTAVLYCALEIFCVAELCFESDEQSFVPAWLWAMGLSMLLAVACLTRLHLLVLLVPLLILLVMMMRPSGLMFAMIAAVALLSTGIWFWHMYKVSGHPLGSNASLLIYGEDGYKENQIFCSTSIPTYERLFRNLSQKEFNGFLWHMQHGWQLLGCNPMTILFLASLTHAYKRRRTQMFQWLLLVTALVIIAANNFGVANPEVLGPWNNLGLLLPGMVVVGSAFFFIQLERLDLQVMLVNSIIVVSTLVITAIPMELALTSSNNLIYNFPPYLPPLIKVAGQYAQPDEWVTTDMPWASAWYADRASLWLPDSITDFQHLHDNVCPTGMLFFTPVSWVRPASTFLTGEDKDWLPLISASYLPPNSTFPNNLPPNSGFPLTVHTATAAGVDYVLWSDRPRWNSQ